MGEIIGFLGGIFFTLFALSVFIYALSELKIFNDKTAALTSGIYYTFALMLGCYFAGFIYFTVSIKNIDTDLFFNIWGGLNGKMNSIVSDFSFSGLKESGFMPLYPVLVKILGSLCFSQYEFVAIMLSSICMSISVYYFYLIYDKPGLFILLFPLSFTGFMALPYSMGLMFSVMVFYYTKKNRGFISFLLCALLVLTDIRGILIIIPIYMINPKKRWVFLGAIIPAILLYIFYGTFLAESEKLRLFSLALTALFVISKKKSIAPELVYGMVLIIAGYVFPFMRVNLLLALPVAVALETYENTFVKYFAVFTSCTFLAFMLVNAI